MSTKYFGVISMEDDTPSPAETALTSMDDYDAETAEVEIREAAGVLVNEAQAIQDTATALQSLSEVRQTLVEAQELGDISTAATVLIRKRVETILSQAPDIASVTEVLPSLESFQSYKAYSLNVSVESLGETISKGWEKFLEMFSLVI